jgi:hypothetical protein
MLVGNLRFDQTCMACPEQYDVYLDDTQVGYVRLRWGMLRAYYPDYKSKSVQLYEFQFEDGWTGEFPDERQRKFHLESIANILYNYHMLQKEVV